MKKCILWGNWVSKRSRKGLGETLTIKKHFLTFTLSVNKIIVYQFSVFKSLDSIASVVGIFMYLTISKFKQVLRSRKGLDYNTAYYPIAHCNTLILFVLCLKCLLVLCIYCQSSNL